MQLEPEAEDRWLQHWVETAYDLKRVHAADAPFKLGLAVSGGSDSMAMLHLFARCAKEQNYKLSAATIDHGLRSEAKEEAAFVGSVCAELGVSHEVLTWDGWDGSGNLQAMARDARYRLLAEWGALRGVKSIAVGHTVNDLSETFLMRLARGSGLDGLAAMERHFERHGMAFSRPLLFLERDMLRSYLTRHGAEWRDDPSNEDEQFQRVTARKVLAALDPLGVGIHEISGAAHDLQLAKSALRSVVHDRAAEIVKFEGGDVVVSWDDKRMTHTEIFRRLLSAIVQWVGATDYPPRADALHELGMKTDSYTPHTLNGCFVTQSKTELRVTREFNPVKDLACDADALWDGRWHMTGSPSKGLTIRALGDRGLKQCPEWRETGLPRASLLASPAIWRGEELIAAPVAGLPNGWCARLTRSREQFLSSLLSH